MRSPGGWDIAVAAATAVLVALLVTNGAEGGELYGALAVLLGLLLVWFAIGRTAEEGGARAYAASALLILLAGVGTAISPSMATMQAIVFPLLWKASRSTRDAVAMNVLLALLVGAGYFVALGGTVGAFWQALVIETISLAGSFAIGFWITRISEESAARERLLDELRATQDRLAVVSRDAGVLSERERLAREIHDTIAQDLTGLVLLAQRTRRELVGGSPTVGETIDLLEHGARAALAETRALVASSAPVALAEGGIAAALVRLGERFGRETGIAVDVRADAGGPLDRDTEVVLLRCAQEGLANVRKHSGAAGASVALVVSDAAATLVVRDDGSGFDAAAPRDGYGLDGLTARLALVGGTLGIETSPGSGTVLSASLPLARVGA
jgi:signal transduction histidine kinase